MTDKESMYSEAIMAARKLEKSDKCWKILRKLKGRARTPMTGKQKSYIYKLYI
jgi:predicted nucleotidyltransferase